MTTTTIALPEIQGSGRAAQRARLEQYAAKELRDLAWGVPQITERVVDLMDAEQFPEMALAREHARRRREGEARHG